MNKFSYYVEHVTSSTGPSSRRHVRRHSAYYVWPALLIAFAFVYFGSRMA